MKTYFLIFLLFSFIYSCKNSSIENNSTPVSIYPQPRIVPLNLNEGYQINPINGDSIKSIINSLGDTVQTGVELTLQSVIIDMDSVKKPLEVTPEISKLTESVIRELPLNSKPKSVTLNLNQRSWIFLLLV